ncbi:hypothetical protein FNH13_06690 [Ornithinimicrobium ciconiae]|uniref:HTH luxR-type domain-containing protein n=1 Tax=Ornithinimicrobium ciconiae TaxID=2594265 RepID=A0A516G9B5_9MICO|nr:hypothetical protein FNH13_06690 [Ornithinimicrobium ciconiae]
MKGVPTGRDPFEVVVEIVTAVSRAPDRLEERVDAIIDILLLELTATVGLLVRADLARLHVQVVGRMMRPGATRSLTAQVRDQLSDPLLGPMARGDLRPTTAQRAYGVRAWELSKARAGCLISFGVEQVAALPVHGQSDVVAFLVGRAGQDFTDEDLALLRAVQPVVTGLGVLLRLPGTTASQPARDAADSGLTDREAQVLELLAHGYKAAVIGRLAGCSTRTVHRHLGHIYDKLGVSDRLSAVNQAHLLGMIAIEAADIPSEDPQHHLPQLAHNHSPG